MTSFLSFHTVTPISRKGRINALLMSDYLVILCFYLLLSITGIFTFSEINDLYTLNFQPKPGEPWHLLAIHYFLSLFPVFTLATNFPIIAITLRNNLKALFLTEGAQFKYIHSESCFPRLCIFGDARGIFLASTVT